MASKAWNTVTGETIQTVSENVALHSLPVLTENSKTLVVVDLDDFIQWNEVLKLLQITKTTVSSADFVNIHEDVLMTEFLEYIDIVNNVVSTTVVNIEHEESPPASKTLITR